MVRSKARTDLCPGCYRKGTEEFIREEEVGRRDRVRTQIVRDAIHLDKDDRLVGSTLKEVQTKLRTIVMGKFFRCKECGQEWHTISTSTFER